MVAVGAEAMESNVSHRVEADDELLERARPFEPDDNTPYQPPDPPSIDGTCNRCGYRGKVYPGRYGGWRCAVCFALQNGWMPRG